MAFIGISGEPGCRQEELARVTAERLGFELVTEPRVCEMVGEEFGEAELVPDKVWPLLARAILARLGVERHLVISSTGAEFLLHGLPSVLRTHIVAPDAQRVGNLMVDRGWERKEATERLRAMDSEAASARKKRFGLNSSRRQAFDLIFNAESLAVEQMADLLECAVKSKGLAEAGLLLPAAEAQVQFEVRLKLARYGIRMPDRVAPKRKEFGHPSEEVFANLLDFYRIPWDYEPRSFPLQWDKDGRVSEAFTPDFYLPEFDLYVELTTMKQANVTKKNRKIRLLRAIYPHINIQVFYQKDVQDLVLKYGLPERLAR
jgi:cytidylate kinase